MFHLGSLDFFRRWRWHRCEQHFCQNTSLHCSPGASCQTYMIFSLRLTRVMRFWASLWPASFELLNILVFYCKGFDRSPISPRITCLHPIYYIFLFTSSAVSLFLLHSFVGTLWLHFCSVTSNHPYLFIVICLHMPRTCSQPWPKSPQLPDTTDNWTPSTTITTFHPNRPSSNDVEKWMRKAFNLRCSVISRYVFDLASAGGTQPVSMILPLCCNFLGRWPFG